MQTFDQSLFALYKNGLVTLRDAMATASHPTTSASPCSRPASWPPDGRPQPFAGRARARPSAPAPSPGRPRAPQYPP